MTPLSSHWLTSFKSKSKYLKIMNSTCLNNTVLFILFMLFVSFKKNSLTFVSSVVVKKMLKS